MTGTARMEAAWSEYRAGIENLRRIIYEHPAASAPEGAATAHYLFHQIQAIGFNVAIAPRQESPRFYSHQLFEPTNYTWTSPAADYFYRKAFVDGQRRYRIWGRRSNSRMLLLQVLGGYLNDPLEHRTDLGSYDFDRFEIAADGSFEITASAEPVPHNWVRLDPTRHNICLMGREVFNDWERETPTELHIEPLDAIPAPLPLSEDAFIERMQGALRLMNYAVTEWSIRLVDEAVKRGYNRFADAELERQFTHAAGINPFGGFYMAAYDVRGDQALIIEIENMHARYWGIQLADYWHQNTNYVDHQSSLNGVQAQVDEDRVCRCVVSLRDPGVPNWLDPVGLERGSIDLRFLEATAQPTVKCRVVPLSKLREALPSSTPIVRTEQRNETLRHRRRAALRRWGY